VPHSFLAVAREYFQTQDDIAESTKEKREYLLQQLHALHDTPIGELTTPGVVCALKDIESKDDRHETAHRCGMLVGRVTRFAVNHSDAAVNVLPMGKLRGALKPVKTDTFYEIDSTHALPHHLILQTVIAAGSLREANLNAHPVATLLVAMIAFANNAHIEPPARWYSYEVAATDDWRTVGQIEFETSRPLLSQRFRKLNPNTTTQFVAKFVEGYNRKDGQKFHQAIGIYGRALENWQQMTAVFAAHYLFIAAETLTTIAVSEYLTQQGKTEDELLEKHFRQRIPETPKGATAADDAAIAAIIKRMEAPAKRGARNDLYGEVRRNTIFRDAPESYRTLREATDGFEHGHHEIDETYALMLPHIDKAAECLRKWIINQTMRDEGLRTELLGGETGCRWSLENTACSRERSFSLVIRTQLRRPPHPRYE
jgi:hypothetical protein